MTPETNASKRTHILLSLIATILLINVAMPLMEEPAPPPPPAKFQYKIQTVNDLAWKSEMGSLGDAGWELVFARRARDSITETYGYECIFKKKK